jgi:hypothetical protein
MLVRSGSSARHQLILIPVHDEVNSVFLELFLNIKP